MLIYLENTKVDIFIDRFTRVINTAKNNKSEANLAGQEIVEEDRPDSDIGVNCFYRLTLLPSRRVNNFSHAKRLYLSDEKQNGYKMKVLVNTLIVVARIGCSYCVV